MKACRIHRFGPPDVIAFEETTLPPLAEHEILVQTKAAGVGPWDAWVRSGKSVLEQPLPLTLGSEFSGIVAQLGLGVHEFALGQEVFGATNQRFTGGYAEYAVASAAMVSSKPQALNHVESAGLPVVAVTALQMLFDHAQIQQQQRVLIHGSGGGVGASAVQLARAAGAYVIGTEMTRSVEYVTKLGADQVIDNAKTDFEAMIEPVDAVIDTVGGAIQSRSFAVIKRGGVIVSSVSQPNLEQAARGAVRALFILVDVTTLALTRIAGMVDCGQLRPRSGPVLSLREARVAHEMLEGVRQRQPGKIVLTPD